MVRHRRAPCHEDRVSFTFTSTSRGHVPRRTRDVPGCPGSTSPSRGVVRDFAAAGSLRTSPGGTAGPTSRPSLMPKMGESSASSASSFRRSMAAPTRRGAFTYLCVRHRGAPAGSTSRSASPCRPGSAWASTRSSPRQPRAEGALAARPRRRTRPGRLRPRPSPRRARTPARRHHGPARRTAVGRQRVEGLHHQRGHPDRSVVSVTARTGTSPTARPRSARSSCPMAHRASPSTRRTTELGWHISDTHGLSFSDVRVPEENLLGETRPRLPAVPRHPRRRPDRDQRPRPGLHPGLPGDGD